MALSFCDLMVKKIIQKKLIQKKSFKKKLVQKKSISKSLISKEVYVPSDDSFLLEREIRKRNLVGKVCLDLGTGSGVQGIAMLKSGASFVVCADINKNALVESKKNVLKYLKETKNFDVVVRFVETDLFSNLKGVKFDFIVFNPPYVPSEKIKWVDLDGGKEGSETINKFITQFVGHLSSSSEILLLISSLNNPKKLINIFEKKGFFVDVVSKEKLFFEELFVLSIKK